MTGKQRYLRSIDIRIAGTFDAGGDIGSTAAIAPPAQAAIGAPTINLPMSTAIERNASTPTSQIGATWLPPAGVAPSSYIVQWSLSNTFPIASTPGQAASAEATTISGLIPATIYYVRVAAYAGNVQGDWSATASITTAADTVAPNPVTSPAATFVGGGDLVITWVNPTSANFRDVEIVIKASSGGATLATLYSATQQRVWTVADNLTATSNVGDPTLYVELRARSWGGIFSTTVNTGTVTKAAPTAPTLATLVSGYSVLIASVTSTPESPYSLFEYVWKRDGTLIVTRLSTDTTDAYTAGAAGDEGNHSWTCTVRQRDIFGQYSSATVSGAVALDVLTIAQLRSGLFYSDSVGNSTATLSVLKDDNKVSGGVAYAA